MIGMRRWLAGLCLLAFCALVQAQVPHVAKVREFDDIIASGVLKVALYQDFPPYSYSVEGEARGVDVELARQLASGLGLEMEVMWVVPDETLDDDLRNFIWRGHYLRPGVVADVMMRVPYDREFSYKQNELGELINELVVMFGPYQRERWQTAFDARQLDEVPSVAVFQYHPVGVEVESVPSFYLSSVLNGNIRKMLHHYPTTQAAFAAMQAGEVHATMGMRGEIDWLLKQADDSNLRLGDNAYPNLGRQVWDLGMAVHESNRQLAYAIEGVLEGLISDGGLERIYTERGLRYELPGLYQAE